ncbi:MAG: ABC transporter permease [Treponema sp.]|jgi:simple sugar transport system permease protein|nr:ABC transporter permease [Treponema sp.]
MDKEKSESGSSLIKSGRSLINLKNRLAAPGGMFLILVISFGVLIILAFLLSKTPGRTLNYFFLGPLRNLYYFGNMLNSAIPLIFGGLGICVAMQANCFNLGGEGQIYIGAFVTTISALALAPLGLSGAVLALAAGAAVSGLAAGISGFLKIRWNTSELITSFLLSNALVLIISFFITGPFLDPATNLQSTRKIPDSFRLPLILPPSNLSAALFLAVTAVILVYLFLYKSRIGYELRMSGLNKVFAQYGGIHTSGKILLAMFLSGLLYGLGGGMAIYGTYYSTMKEFSSGMGWNGLAVALIARNKPQAVIPAAVFFAWIGSGARIAMQFSDITFEIASIVQSVVFFLVTSTVLLDIFKKQRAAG